MDKVSNDQEVTGEPHIDDDVDLVIEPVEIDLALFLGHFAIGRETRFEAPLEAAFDLTVPEVGEAFWRFDAPADTRLVDRGRGIVEVAGGGPWRIEEGYVVDGETYATMRVAGAGECVVTDWSDPDGDGIRERFATVGCP